MPLISPDGSEFVLRSGDKPTTQIGYVNANRQICHGTFGVYGAVHNQYAYRLSAWNAGTCTEPMAVTLLSGCA